METTYEKPLFSRFFKNTLENTPYQDTAEQLWDCIHLAEMYLSCALLLREQSDLVLLHGVPPASDKADSVLRSEYLENRKGQLSGVLREDLLRAWDQIDARTAATDLLSPTALTRLCGLFLPDRFSRLCLFLALANCLDRKFEPLFALLQNDGAATAPTVGLAWGLFIMPVPAPDFSICANLLWRETALHLLYEPAPQGKCGLEMPLTLLQNVFQELLGYMPTTESPCCGRLINEEERQEVLFGKERIDAFCAAAQAAYEGDPAGLYLYGEKGSGRLFTVRQFAARSGRLLLLADSPRLLRLDALRQEGAFWRLASLAAINGCIPVLCDLEPPDEELALCNRLFEIFFQSGIPCLILLSVLPSKADCSRYYSALRFPVEPPTPQEVVRLWREGARGLPLSPVLDFTLLSNKYRLCPGQIPAVLKTAAMLSACAGETEIAQAIAMHNQGNLMRHSTKLKPIFTFSDLILSETSIRQIRCVINRIRYSYQVNVDWNFDKKFAYGRGVSLLLYGPPGTGKTMCAHVLANELGLELYKVDLAGLVSKYVGETEKNLGELFRDAQKSNAILFFDEADALFSKRSTESNGSNDKYANMETSYLLQKMEEYCGVTILATNLAGSFDKAFYRRINYVVNVAFPDEATRAILWRASFPADCPLAPDVDFSMLSHVESSPSTIKSVALESAFRAAAEGCTAVGICHILSAMRDELSKQGKTLSKQEMLGLEGF